MTRRFYAHNDTLTKAEHDALELTRPFTDSAIGGMTDGRRSNGAFLSALFVDASAMPVFERRMPRSGDLRPPEASKGPSGTETTPKHAEEHTA